MLILWQYGNFPDNLEIYRIFWKLSDNLVTCQTIWKLSRPSILSRLYGKFLDKTKTFQTIQKRSRQSGNFSDDLGTFQKLKGISKQVLDIIDKSFLSTKTFRTRKILRQAMLPCSLRISVSRSPLGPMCETIWSKYSPTLRLSHLGCNSHKSSSFLPSFSKRLAVHCTKQYLDT